MLPCALVTPMECTPTVSAAWMKPPGLSRFCACCGPDGWLGAIL